MNGRRRHRKEQDVFHPSVEAFVEISVLAGAPLVVFELILEPVDEIGDDGLLGPIEPRHSASALVLIEPGILEPVTIAAALRGERDRLHGLPTLELMEPDTNSLREI